MAGSSSVTLFGFLFLWEKVRVGQLKGVANTAQKLGAKVGSCWETSWRSSSGSIGMCITKDFLEETPEHNGSSLGAIPGKRGLGFGAKRKVRFRCHGRMESSGYGFSIVAH